MVFGASRSSYLARCRFYKDDTRATFIRWDTALPGAEIYRGVTPFHPDRNQYTSDRLQAGECGEMDSPRRVFVADNPRAGVPGDHLDATPQDIAGQSMTPALNPDGTAVSVPDCGLVGHPPLYWAYCRGVIVDGVTLCI